MKRVLYVILFFGILLPFPLYAKYPVEIPLYDCTYSNLAVESCWGYLATMDGPGSSTVDPVDPNLARAELSNNTLVVSENGEGEAEIKVYKYDSREKIFIGTFDSSISLQLTDTAKYVIWMGVNKSGIERNIVGKFQYPSPAGLKEIRQGQLYVLQGEKVYTIQGKEVK